jgi:hypothetical protein
MAQYTPILAEEFNAVRSTIVEAIGDGGGNRNFGLGITPISTTVSAGQLISPAEFTNLAWDINTGYYYQYGEVAPLADIVQGGTITWANLVSYQNRAQQVRSGVSSGFTYYDVDFGKLGGYPNMFDTSTGQRALEQGWGGGLDGATGGQWVLRVKVKFFNDNHLRYFFNGGGFIEPYMFDFSGVGNPQSSPINKDYAYVQLLYTSNGVPIDKTKWWANGGSGGPGTSSGYNVLYSTADIEILDGSLYQGASSSMTIRHRMIYDTAGEIKIETTVTDLQQFTSTGSTSPAPPIGIRTIYNLLVSYPNADAPRAFPEGGGSFPIGSAVQLAPPSFENWDGGIIEWVKVY